MEICARSKITWKTSIRDTNAKRERGSATYLAYGSGWFNDITLSLFE
jgi:hypothetical protein